MEYYIEMVGVVNEKDMVINFLVIVQVLYLLPVSAFASEKNGAMSNRVELSVSYLSEKQLENGTWGETGKGLTDDINQILEYMYFSDHSSDIVLRMIDNVSDYFYTVDTFSTENLSRYLLIDDIRDDEAKSCLCNFQNPDGGFGLAEGYTSDIIDTKLALKALVDCGETDAMTNAAVYIASLQNEDGGFGYQPGLGSNPLLSAEIADILIDTISLNPTLSHYLDDTFTALENYLDANLVAVPELSADDIDSVYQHFHTALFNLKKDGKYNSV